jgi:hypothetical protein
LHQALDLLSADKVREAKRKVHGVG